MEQHQIIVCPKCQKKLRLPSNLGMLSVKCPNCLNEFLWEPHKRVTNHHEPVLKKRLAKIVGISLCLLIAVALLIYHNQNILKHLAIEPQQAKWVTISYLDLIDPQAIIRTGQTLKSALADPNMRGAIQPFVDSYSFLLEHTLEMISGPAQPPHSDLVKMFLAGSAQPGWVSILRGGRLHVTANNQNDVRIFAVGNDPHKAYDNNYSVIRHCLNALVPSNSSALNVEVYAYENDYEKSELRLNLSPYIISASAFPSKGLPLNLTGLAAFFDETPEIQGARLDRSEGLTLYGKLGAKQTLAGADISLSDFVVAYRAVFHAGDNQPFVSLDPHLDATKVTVNFGGFLEDTRIGSVVLAADKRFKTVTSGLDPNTFSDLRSYTRKHVASFLSVSEQELLDSSSLSHGKWIGTRFWFYPDSIGIESDLDYQFAVITKPVFMADAERCRDDFTSPEEFERKKRATLSPSIRRNIGHLNQNYAQYASAFGELSELTAVARLMGVCSWLYKARPKWLDLDSLLSVEVPICNTPREKTQLVAACCVSCSNSDALTTDYIVKNSSVVYLSPILDKKVSDHFGNSSKLAKYLCVKNGMKEENYKAYDSEAAQLFKAYRNMKVRDIIKTKEELKALASYSAASLHVQEPSVAKTLKNNIISSEKSLERLGVRIEQIERSIDSAGNVSIYNRLVDEHNELVSEYKAIGQRYNQLVNRYNSLNVEYPFIIEIGGGINLEPRNFKIKPLRSSARLNEFRQIMDKVGTQWQSINGSGKWIRSRTGAGSQEAKIKLPRIEWMSKKESTLNGTVYTDIQSSAKHQYWSAMDSQTGSWRDCRKIDGSSYQERSYQVESAQLQIAEFHAGELKSCIAGKRDTTGRIVFRRLDRKDVLKPQEPPIWFTTH